MKSNFYQIDKLANYMLYNTILDRSNSYKTINGVKCVNLNDCRTWLKKD